MDDEIILTDEKLEQSFTDSAFKMYMREISRYPILSIEEQKELARRYKESGDLEARDLLINCNLRLVVMVANRYKSRIKHLQVLDIIQEGNLGLFSAIEKYDPEKGAFTTYAVPWIRQKITRALSDKDDEIRKPVHIVEIIPKYLAIINESERKGKPIPSDAEICEILEITPNTLKNIRETLKQNPMSLNQPTDEDEESELEDFIPSKTNDYDELLKQMANDELLLVSKEILSPLQYFIIYHRILSDDRKTLEEIASQFHVTRERIRQLEKASLAKIKPYMGEDNKMFKRVLQRIKNREGKKLDSFKRTPLSPLQIIRYMFLKDELNELERKLYELHLLGKYNYKDEEYASILGITLQELKNLMNSLKAKINQKFRDPRSFQNFQREMMKTNGTRIFDIEINHKEKIIHYLALEEKYALLSLDEILAYFREAHYDLTKDEENLLKKFYGSIAEEGLSARLVEKEINLLLFGFRKKDKHVPLKKLYQEFIRGQDMFSEEQQLYLETYFFGKQDRSIFDIDFPDSKLHQNRYFLIEKLERCYYHIHDYFENNFTKENWLEVKAKYWERFSDDKIEYLDLYYGVKRGPYTITEIAEEFEMDYIKLHNIIKDARELAINLFCNIGMKIAIKNHLYIPYIQDPHYEFTEETRSILKLLLLEEKSYEEISKQTGLNKTRISNIVTDGIRRIDFYRFGIISCFPISEEELNDFFAYYQDNITPVEKEIIRLKYLNLMKNKDIAVRVGKTLQEVNKYVSHFYTLYERYMIRDVVLTDSDIKNEIERHPSESIWTEEYKEFASFYFGIKNKYNKTGVKLKPAKIMKKYGYTKNAYYHIYINMIKQLKLRKIDYIKPENNYISREQLDQLLDDVHLPISDKEREIICYLFELKGYPLKSLEELTTIFHDNKDSIRRRYQRAIVSIYKYLNHEIEGNIHYETDIVPILKYFGISDRMKIEDFYKNGFTYEEMAKKYGITFNQIAEIMNRIKVMIYDIKNNPYAKKFDFDYYLKARNNPDLPFTGDLPLAIQIFDLAFGMSGEERMVAPEIIKRLQLNAKKSTVNNVINRIMLSVCKLKDGIKNNKTFSFQQVYSYFMNHCDKIPPYRKKIYKKYFKKVKREKNIAGRKSEIPSDIIYDIIKDTYPNAFTLATATKEEVEALINKYGKELHKRIRKELMRRFHISERNYMSGKDINHVFKLLYTLDERRKELGISDVTLKKENNG